MQRFVVDVIVRMDRANDGMTCPEIYEMIESLCPHLTRLQCKRSFTETIRHRFRTELTGIVIAQKSTTKRSGHTEKKTTAQQHHGNKGNRTSHASAEGYMPALVGFDVVQFHMAWKMRISRNLTWTRAMPGAGKFYLIRNSPSP